VIFQALSRAPDVVLASQRPRVHVNYENACAHYRHKRPDCSHERRDSPRDLRPAEPARGMDGWAPRQGRQEPRHLELTRAFGR
jgi:hypothetical protein